MPVKGGKIAVVLMNLGGPDRPEAVRPFLFSLFNDRRILTLPQPVRGLLAWIISTTRAPTARETYGLMGGGSPILPNTEAQANALSEALEKDFDEIRCFIAMRHWQPRTEEAALLVKDYAPDRIILLPLYPQFSTTTTQSALDAWNKAAKRLKIDIPTTSICCFPTDPGFIEANADLVAEALPKAATYGKPRILFSAHSLPEKIVKAGDPYQWQTERTAAAIVERLKRRGLTGLDWLSTYQSKVGPIPWIGPSTEDEIHRAADEKVPLIVVPMSFVSEHVETTVEIGMEYADLAEELGVPYFLPVETASVRDSFIDGLASLVRQAWAQDKSMISQLGPRICPRGFADCCQARALNAPEPEDDIAERVEAAGNPTVQQKAA